MGRLFDLAGAMTGCLFAGSIAGQVIALAVLALLVVLALCIAARLLDSRLTAPVLLVGMVVGTGVAVYAIGSLFAVFEKDRGDLHPARPHLARCEQAPLPGREVRGNEGPAEAGRSIAQLR